MFLSGMNNGYDHSLIYYPEADNQAELGELESFEKYDFISEIDEARVEEVAGIMSDVFSEDVLMAWTEISSEQKAAYLNEYYMEASKCLGIDAKGVIVEPMHTKPGYIRYGYTTGDGYIHINKKMLDNPRYLQNCLMTVTHEMRHQFQFDAIAHPEAFADIPDQIRNKWAYNFEHYISGKYDYEGYYNQPVEKDAREYEERVFNVFKTNLNGG